MFESRAFIIRSASLYVAHHYIRILCFHYMQDSIVIVIPDIVIFTPILLRWWEGEASFIFTPMDNIKGGVGRRGEFGDPVFRGRSYEECGLQERARWAIRSHIYTRATILVLYEDSVFGLPSSLDTSLFAVFAIL